MKNLISGNFVGGRKRNYIENAAKSSLTLRLEMGETTEVVVIC